MTDTEGVELNELVTEIITLYIQQIQNPPRYIPRLSPGWAFVRLQPTARNRLAVLDTGSLEPFINTL